MKKKLMICLAAVVLLGAVGIYMAGKGKWKEEMDLFGPLNVMQQDAQLTSNDGEASYEIAEKKDIKVTNEFHIYQGTVRLTVYFQDAQICQKQMDAGDYVFDTDMVPDSKGVIHIKYNASEDVDGSYSIRVQTRERRWNRILHRITNYF